MITVENDAVFLDTLRSLDQDVRKLLLGQKVGNRILPAVEIRKMATAGGYQFGFAEIDTYTNQRYGSRYSPYLVDIYLRAIDMEHKYRGYEWILVEDCEHTINTEY